MRQQYDHITRGACVEASYYLPLPSKFYQVYHNYLINVKFIYYLPYLLCMVVFPRGLH